MRACVGRVLTASTRSALTLGSRGSSARAQAAAPSSAKSGRPSRRRSAGERGSSTCTCARRDGWRRSTGCTRSSKKRRSAERSRRRRRSTIASDRRAEAPSSWHRQSCDGYTAINACRPTAFETARSAGDRICGMFGICPATGLRIGWNGHRGCRAVRHYCLFRSLLSRRVYRTCTCYVYVYVWRGDCVLACGVWRMGVSRPRHGITINMLQLVTKKSETTSILFLKRPTS